MLRDAAAELQKLKPRRSKPTDGHLQIVRAQTRPEFLGRRGDGVEIHFDALGFLGANADDVEDLRQKILRRRRIESQWKLLENFILPDEPIVLANQIQAVGFQLIEIGSTGQWRAPIAGYQRI